MAVSTVTVFIESRFSSHTSLRFPIPSVNLQVVQPNALPFPPGVFPQ
jgi:hypothetical protein